LNLSRHAFRVHKNEEKGKNQEGSGFIEIFKEVVKL
jgi:hypothetical protein